MQELFSRLRGALVFRVLTALPFIANRKHAGNASLSCFSGVVFVFFICASPWASGQSQQYVNELPDAQRVLSDMRGENEMDTAARQLAALQLFREVIQTFSSKYDIRHMQPAEAAKLRSYLDAHKRVREAQYAKHDRTCKGPDCDGPRFSRRISQYESSPQFRQEVLDRYLSKPLQAQYVALQEKEKKRRSDQAKAQTPPAGKVAARDESSWIEHVPVDYRGYAAMIDSVPRSVWALLLAIWLFAALVLAFPFGLSKEHPLRFRIGQRRRNIHYETGEVVDSQRWTETKTTEHTTVVRNSDGVARYVPSTVVETAQKQRVFLRQPDGKERAIDLHEVDLPVRHGHRIAEVLAAKPQSDEGTYLFFHIYDTGKTAFHPAGLRHTVKMRSTAVFPFVLLATWGGVLLWGDIGGWAFVAALIVYFLAVKVVTRIREGIFRKRFAPLILAVIPEPKPSDAIHLGDGMSIRPA
jgi:hypothetical protein